MNHLLIAEALIVLVLIIAFITGLIRLERTERKLASLKHDLVLDTEALRRWDQTSRIGRGYVTPRDSSKLIGEPAYVISKAQLLTQINACIGRLTTGANPPIPERTHAQIREELQTLLAEIEYFGGPR